MRVLKEEIDRKPGRPGVRRIRRQLRKETAFAQLLQTVTSVTNESNSLEEPLQTTLDAICGLTGWPIGHALLKKDDKDELASARLWHLEGEERFGPFRAITEALTFGDGVGLPGRVLAKGAPEWIVDVTKDTNFPRNQLVHDLGLRAAFAFPILVRREVVGVLEFFHTQREEPDAALLMVMQQVGAQLGRVVERRRSEQTLTRLARGIAAEGDEDLLRPLAANLARGVRADYAIVGELKEGSRAIRTLAVCALGEMLPNFEYELSGTPCEEVVAQSFCSYPEGVQEKFPRDRMLVDMGVQAYVGTPLFDLSGRVLGLLAVMWRKPLTDQRAVQSMVQIFAIRAAAELERKQAQATAEKLAAVPRASPHPILEFSGEGVLRFSNRAAHTLARSLGKDDPIHILPADTAGVVKKCMAKGHSGLVVDTLADGRTIIWSFIPLVKNDSVFAHAFELTLFLDLHEEMRRIGAVSREPRPVPRGAASGRGSWPGTGTRKERVH